jgi:CheY-like chemotaxis protein
VTAAPFDVVLMDMSMPVMNGLEATAAVRALAQSEHEPRFATTPIIGISANAMAGDRDACFAAGMNAYVTKPIKRDDLLTSIVGSLGLRKVAIDSQGDNEKLLNGN